MRARRTMKPDEVHSTYRAGALMAGIVLMLTALCGACRAERDGGGESDSDAGAASTPRPATRTTTLALEGTTQPVELRLYRAPAGFPLKFSTYLPSELAAETVPADSGAGVRFAAVFGGRPAADAFLYVYVYPERTTLREAAAQLRAFITSRGLPVSEGESPPLLDLIDPASGAADPYPWSLEDYTYTIPGTRRIVGSAAFGMHADRFFHLIVQYPEERAEGFVPRSDVVLDQWRWEDTGEMLESAAGP